MVVEKSVADFSAAAIPTGIPVVPTVTVIGSEIVRRDPLAIAVPEAQVKLTGSPPFPRRVMMVASFAIELVMRTSI
jgi:hypothetical protein